MQRSGRQRPQQQQQQQQEQQRWQQRQQRWQQRQQQPGRAEEEISRAERLARVYFDRTFGRGFGAALLGSFGGRCGRRKRCVCAVWALAGRDERNLVVRVRRV
jgi:hypothetical protein